MRFFGKGVTALVDEKLKDEMTKAYEVGEYDKALKLSQKLDKQILKSYQHADRKKRPLRKDNSKGREM